MTTLLHERGTLGFALQAALEVQVRKLAALARDRGADPLQRDQIAREWIEMQALRFTNYRSLSQLVKTGMPGPGGLDREARLVGGEPARDEARARAPRPRRGARRGQRALRRLLAVPAAPQPRQHDRGRDLGGAPQHRRRARARPPHSRADGLHLHTRAGGASRAGPLVPRRASGALAGAELAELGWTGVSIAEEDGGAGLGFVEEAVLFEELGRALYRGPVSSRPSRWRCPRCPTTCGPRSPRARRAGRSRFGPLVPDLDTADRDRDRRRRRHLRARGRRARDALDTTDETRPLGVVRGGEPGRRLADAGVLDEIRSRSLAALAIEACGVARRALEYAIEHASTREQFGKRIGVYQAVSHPLADAYTRLELAQLARRYWAAWCVAEGDEQAAVAAAAAKAFAAEAAVGVCETAIQVHGGIGFTWEHVLHRLYKRALWIESFARLRDPAPGRGRGVAARRKRRGVRLRSRPRFR